MFTVNNLSVLSRLDYLELCASVCVRGRRGQVALAAGCVVAPLAPPLGLACNYNRRGSSDVEASRRRRVVVKNSKIELVRSLLVLFVIAYARCGYFYTILYSTYMYRLTK